MQEVEALCDHIAVIADGSIAAESSLPRILRSTGKTNLEDAFVELITSEKTGQSSASGHTSRNSAAGDAS